MACRGPDGWTPSYAFANCYAKGSDSVGAHTGKVVLTRQSDRTCLLAGAELTCVCLLTDPHCFMWLCLLLRGQGHFAGVVAAAVTACSLTACTKAATLPAIQIA